jgi:hypothetical protein
VHEVLLSPGAPLDAAARAFMELRFGYDFSRVRVHTDAEASESAQEVDALAYTVGHHIVFGTANMRLIEVPTKEKFAKDIAPGLKKRGVLTEAPPIPKDSVKKK